MGSLLAYISISQHLSHTVALHIIHLLEVPLYLAGNDVSVSYYQIGKIGKPDKES